MAFFADFLGTLRSTLRIGPPAAAATVSASPLTAPRTHGLPDHSGVLQTACPTLIATGERFNVYENTQVLYSDEIEIDGEIEDHGGVLIEVA